MRTTSTISTNAQHAGETFTATLEEPLTHEGRLLAPKGSEVEGRIVEAEQGGRIKGRADVALRLTKIRTARGHSVEISTNTITTEAPGTRVKLGTAAGVALATRGDPAVIPSETLLRFELHQPVSIAEP